MVPLGALNAAVFAMKGTMLWDRAPGWLLGNILVCLVFGFGPLLLYLASRRRQGRLAARMDKFLSSHSIASARAAIEEIDEFARS